MYGLSPFRKTGLLAFAYLADSLGLATSEHSLSSDFEIGLAWVSLLLQDVRRSFPLPNQPGSWDSSYAMFEEALYGYATRAFSISAACLLLLLAHGTRFGIFQST